VDTVVQPSESRFFKYVWRFNALAIAGAATTCILLGLSAGLSIFNAEPRPHRATHGDAQDGTEARLRPAYSDARTHRTWVPFGRREST